MGKKTYFVTSDIHSFYTIFHNALLDAGWEQDNPNHVLIICGDIFDRGTEAKPLLNFLLSIPEDRLILIRGNHEDLMQNLIDELNDGLGVDIVHYHNGTIGTLCQILNADFNAIDLNFNMLKRRLKKYNTLISRCVPYYELGNYIFVHGWIPYIRHHKYLKHVSETEWKTSAWKNGMEAWKNGWTLKGKTIVCGHWHTSFGNYKYHNIGSGEFEKDSSFEPFIDKGIIALDACAAFSNKVNIYKLTV